MNEEDPRRLRAAREAARWFQRLEEGLNWPQRWRYSRWLKKSPENAEAIGFFQRLAKVLRGKR